MNPNEFRETHLLKRNFGYSSPHSLCFVDTESSPHEHPEIKTKKLHRFRLGVAHYCRLDRDKPTRRSTLPFLTTIAFWAWLEQYYDKRRPVYLFAHNLGFDLTMLGFWQLLESGYFRLADDAWPIRQLEAPGKRKKFWRGCLVTEDAPTIITVRHGDKFTLKCVDTRNYFGESVQALGRRVGMAKLSLPAWEASDAEWFDRCELDVAIIEETMLQLIGWWKAGKYGTWRNTAPGLAWNAYRHGFMGHTIEISGSRSAIRLERESYYGGECRCFYVGEVKPVAIDAVCYPEDKGPNLYHLDTRSLYPSVMAGHLYPCKFRGIIRNCPLDKLPAVMAEHAVCAECIVKSEYRDYPIRINRKTFDQQDGQTRYCIGTFRTWLAGPELAAAHAAGDLVELGELAYYEQADLFTDYVNHFWGLRETALKEGNETYARFYKLLLNSLPGKFAQRQWRWEEDMTFPSPIAWGEWYHYDTQKKVPQLYRSVQFYTQKNFRTGEWCDSFPLIAGYVTAYARKRMRELRTIAGARNVFYQDTDSLHVSHAGYKNLVATPAVCGEGLGQLYVKGSHYEARYFGLKHYQLDGQLTYGGSSRTESAGERRQNTQIKFTKLNAAIGNGVPESVTVSEHSVTPCLSHPDGQVGADGWVTPPILPDADPFSAFGKATGEGWLFGTS